MQSELVPYLGVVALITVTPGADTAVVVRSALAGGARRGVATALGSASGLLVWGAATALGIAAVASLTGLSLYAYLVARAGDVLRRPHVRRRLDQCSGAVLILLGLRGAVERRA